MSILIKNATILTPAKTMQGDLLIQGNLISNIAKNINDKDADVIDGKGKIAIPGLVNAHTHVSMTLMRGYGEDLPLHRWLEEKIWPAEAKQSVSEIKSASLLAFCEMIRSGTTAFADMCLFDTKPVFEAADKIGIRGIIARGAMDFHDSRQTKKLLAEAAQSAEYGSGTRLRASVASHAPYTCSEDFLIKTKELAKKKKLKYQIHVSETRTEIFDILNKHGKYPFEYLESIGLMDGDSIFAHAGWLTKREIGLAGKTRLNIASCPISNLKLATGGISQITELDRAGANVCLGTDSAVSNNSLNMFETMKMASLLQKHHYWKADILPAKKIFDFATINGANALGFSSGSLEPGKLADVVLLEKGPNLYPEHDLVANLVYSAGPQNVCDVIVDGKIVMQNRELLAVDEKAIFESFMK